MALPIAHDSEYISLAQPSLYTLWGNKLADKEFVRLLEETGTWAEFEADWRRQCEANNEEFENYAEATFAVLREIIVDQHKDAGVYALRTGGKFVAMAQLNRAMLPGYDGYVLRVRHLTICPDIDLGSGTENPYPRVLVDTLFAVVNVARHGMHARHIKFHLRSPADVSFFSALGDGLADGNVFESISTKGMWLHVTDKVMER